MNRFFTSHLFVRLSVLISLLFFINGCKRESAPVEKGFHFGQNSKLIEELAPQDVIVSVNGVALTREVYDDLLVMKEALYVMGKPGATKQELKAVRRRLSPLILQEFLARQLILQAAHQKKHQPSAEAVRISRMDMSTLLKVKEDELEQKFRALGRAGGLLKQTMEENALMRSFRESEHKAELTVTSADIEEQIQAFKAYHARAEATNQRVLALGRTIYEQLKKGEDFKRLATQYSEAEDRPKGEWGEFLKGEIEDAKIREAAFRLPVGEVSEPIETEEGLYIIKVFSRQEEIVGPSLNAGPVKVTLGRIVLRMAVGGGAVELPPREQIEKVVATRKAKALQDRWIPGLAAQALIVYPNGTNLWIKANSEKPVRPQQGMKRLSAKEESK